MAIPFQIPGFLRPPEYKFIPQTIDSIFDAYKQAELLKEKRRIEGVGFGLQYPGVNQETATPMDVQRAYQLANRQAPTVTEIPLQEPDENPNVAALRRIFEQQRSQRTTQSKVAQLGIEETQADINLKGAQAKAFGGDSPPQMQTIGGSQYLVTPSRQGPRYQAAPNQTVPAEIGTKLGLAQDGVENLDFIETMLRSDSGRALAIKAGGNFERLKSLGDPEAEKMANAIFQAADAEARVKTGAAINTQEMAEYFKGLVNPVGTMEGNLDRLSRKKSFFNNQIRLYSGGRPSVQGAGKETPKSPAGKKGGKIPDPLGIR